MNKNDNEDEKFDPELERKAMERIFDDSIEPSGYDREFELEDGEIITLREAMNRLRKSAEENYVAGRFMAVYHGRCVQNEWTLFMGNYYIKGFFSYDDMIVKTPIEWIVLKRDGYKWFLLTKECIDRKSINSWYYDDIQKDEVFDHWDKSEIRQYLNEIFYEKAFSESEKALIIPTTIMPEENIIWERLNGEQTEDKLFLLSASEVEEFLSDEHLRTAKFRSLREQYDEPIMKIDYMNHSWWTRTPGEGVYTITCVDEEGTIKPRGDSYTKELGIRVAMWIDIEKFHEPEWF